MPPSPPSVFRQCHRKILKNLQAPSHLLFELGELGFCRLQVFMTMESNLGQCLFTLDDAFFSAAHGGKRLLDCVWGKEKNLESMGEAAVHGAKSLHTRKDNIMPVVNGWIP
ncbi:hypothetical protein SO802_005417 [Lithocarpus litseifolius]|uniref:Uncharacterized protein n=1 Tax=Lithocarpus litseifolius TaxID=425828 RepID=A0AAW2DJM8_9ROSI